jgi:NAD+ diphosphatase
LRSLFLQLPDALLALAGRASQIVEWDRSHQFCGRCGSATRDRQSERAKECPRCGHIVYPRVSPAMMVLVTRGKELLLARSKRFPQPVYSALAGFVEAGESIEDCIHREVREEVGIEVRDLTYVASQSWPFPHSLMIAYNAEYASGEVRPCDDEIVDARWFGLEELPQLPNPVSIARVLINSTIERLRRA